MALPDWTPLLLGTVQAADFVVGYAELGIQEQAQIEEEIQQRDDITPEEKVELYDRRFKLKQRLFQYAVLKKKHRT